MQHHRHVALPVFTHIACAKTRGQVQVHLQRPALPVAADGIAQHELELWPVERALTRVEVILEPRGLDRGAQRGLRLVPNLLRANPSCPAGRQI